MLLLVATFFMAFVLLLYMLSPLISPKPLALPGAHVVVSDPWLCRHLPGPLGCPEPAPGWAGPATETGPPSAFPPNGGSPAAVHTGTVPAEGLGDPPSAASGSSRARKAGRALQGLGSRCW